MNYLLPFLLFPNLLYAQDATDALITDTAPIGRAAVAPNPALQIGMWILIGIVFYLLLIRPQQKRLKDHQSLISELRRGDRIVTSGGIVGTVQRVLDTEELLVKISEDTTVTIMKQYVTNVLSKSEPTGKAKKVKVEKQTRLLTNVYLDETTRYHRRYLGRFYGRPQLF